MQKILSLACCFAFLLTAISLSGCSSEENSVTVPTEEYLDDFEKKQEDYAEAMKKSYKPTPGN